MKLDINDLLADLETQGRASIAKIGENSAALAKAGETTLQISVQAGKRLVAGKLDLEGATRVAQRSFEQLKTLAVGEGNLVAAGLAGMLEDAIGTIFKMIPFLPKP